MPDQQIRISSKTWPSISEPFAKINIKAKFKGLDANDIYNAMPEDAFPQIAKDLILSLASQQPKAIAADLCKWANGKKRISQAEKT